MPGPAQWLFLFSWWPGISIHMERAHEDGWLRGVGPGEEGAVGDKAKTDAAEQRVSSRRPAGEGTERGEEERCKMC